MSTEFTYSIERYAVDGDEDELLERAELVRGGDGFARRVAAEDRILDADDVPSAIAADPVLSEVRANQITRINATGAAYDHLPLVLTVPGDPDDFDETAWSEALAEEHTEQEWVIQPGRCRPLYVNEERWGIWWTDDGPRALPQEWPAVGLMEFWAELGFSELMSMVSGFDQVRVGLATPGVVAAGFLPDENWADPDKQVSLWKRVDPSSDAQLFTEWLLDWAPDRWSAGDDNFSAMLAQLFIESTRYSSGIPTSGAMLCAGGNPVGFMDGDSAQWTFSNGLDEDTSELVLDTIAARGGRFTDIVTAARDPQSPQGKARRAALEQWEQDRDQNAFDLVARESGYGQ